MFLQPHHTSQGPEDKGRSDLVQMKRCAWPEQHTADSCYLWLSVLGGFPDCVRCRIRKELEAESNVVAKILNEGVYPVGVLGPLDCI